MRCRRARLGLSGRAHPPPACCAQWGALTEPPSANPLGPSPHPRSPSPPLPPPRAAQAWAFQPDNTLKLKPWTGAPGDTGLIDLLPFLQFLATRRIRDVRDVVRAYDGVPDIPAAFKARLQGAVAKAPPTKSLSFLR